MPLETFEVLPAGHVEQMELDGWVYADPPPGLQGIMHRQGWAEEAIMPPSPDPLQLLANLDPSAFDPVSYTRRIWEVERWRRHRLELPGLRYRFNDQGLPPTGTGAAYIRAKGLIVFGD